jgi:hypothetical protein|nr:MAG TPA: hypothetical protein [Bacteriophage sp.]
MIKVETIDISPFTRTGLSPSYIKSIGETYPAIAIYETDKVISVYDGVIKIDGETIDLLGLTISGLFKALKAKGLNVKVFKGMETLPALSIVNYSNTDLVSTEVKRSPIYKASLVSEYIAKGLIGSYSENVEIRILSDNVIQGRRKYFTESEDNPVEIHSLHKAKTFVLMAADANVIRDTARIKDIQQVHDAILDFNLRTYGRDNAYINV